MKCCCVHLRVYTCMSSGRRRRRLGPRLLTTRGSRLLPTQTAQTEAPEGQSGLYKAQSARPRPLCLAGAQAHADPGAMAALASSNAMAALASSNVIPAHLASILDRSSRDQPPVARQEKGIRRAGKGLGTRSVCPWSFWITCPYRGPPMSYM
jgi:hypothetical protein